MKRAGSAAGHMRRLVLALMLVMLAAHGASAQSQIASTVHNLTASGPKKRGDTRGTGSCVFCHTPHNARPTRALWNRDLPPVTYKLYQSSTMQAQVSQPNGSSKLCLSCHDGITALSSVRMVGSGSISQMAPIRGRASLGVDLSDDHPVSFIYNAALALKRGDLVDPAALPRTVPLDNEKRMQCTSCHDPHDDRGGKFLRMDDRFGGGCTTCHRDHNWRSSSHATSMMTWRAGKAEMPWPKDGYSTMAENACLSCHRVHAAPHPQRLLAQSMELKNCTICHNGLLAGGNLEAEFFKPSRHPVEARQWTHDPAEDPVTMPRHVTCVDCHNPHASVPATGTQSGLIPGPLRGVSGMTVGGAPIKEAQYEYEVCLKCHGNGEPVSPGIVRQDVTRNIRFKIGPSAMSFHPLAVPVRRTVQRGLRSGLMPGLNTASVITCTDCHNNDQWRKGGKVPRGPHGSRFEPILGAQYETVDPSPDSYTSYALCYKCHDRGTLMSNASGFPHRQHVMDHQTSCAVCHDPHGSRQNLHTINFEIMSKQGVPVVRPAKNGNLAYVPDPARPGHGKCYMTCHNTEHNGTTY